MTRDTRTAILDIAQDLMQTRGANAISYQHISDVVGIRKASIHYHFPTKDKLIQAVIRRYCVNFLGRVDAILASKDPPPAKLRKYIALFETTLRSGGGEKVCLCGMLGAELASLGSPAARQLQQFFRRNAERLARILDEGRNDGSLRFDGECNTLGMLLFSFLEGGLLIARADGGVRRLRSLADQFMKLLGA